MIPTKLFLRNFMCYRDSVPPLYFDGIHLACLCGDNGNGKSAVVDAITWGIWGKSRAKNDDELIHTGRSEMEVDLDFTVGETLYRVIRKRTRARSRGKSGRPGQTLLEFQVADGDSFKSISGDSVAQTQQRINHTLHMDYATFINSAFLRQGHADEFTIKPPGERKKVLADILGLSLYDGLEEKAKDRVREMERQQSAFESAIQDMQQEIGRRPEYEAALDQTKGELAGVDQQVKEQESQVNVLREKKKGLDFKREQLSELEKATAQARGELTRWQGRLTEHTLRIEGYEKILGQRSAITEGHARLEQTRKEAEQLDLKLRESFVLSKRKDSLVQVINEARGSRLEERGRLQSKVEELEARVEETPRLEEQLAEARNRHEKIAQQEKDIEAKRRRTQELAMQIQNLKSANSQLEQQLKDLRNKLALLAEEDARCPLCETELGSEGKHRIDEKYRAEMSTKADEQRRNESEMRDRVSEHRETSREVAHLESTVNQERAPVQRQIAGLEKELSLSTEAATGLSNVQRQMAQVEDNLKKGEFAIAEQKALREVTQQIADLGYDAQRHQQVQRLMTELGKYEELQRKLEEAERALPSEKTGLDQSKEAITGWNSTLKANTEKTAALAGEIAALPALVSQLSQAEQAYNSLRQRQTRARDKMVSVQERLDYCSQLERKKGEKEQSLLKTLKDKEIYEELAQAFGRRGIQAFLIESALPEIEEESNRLLDRMTGGRMRVSISAQRETRKGDTVETLDIKIRDELGTRSYEMYSGGEAFRINLALRIALSKLLARRAGAPLPTLFIDEGFGTQDANGLGKLIEAINSIQDDFKKIIVISHLEELKEVFPVRIEVTKTGEGSQISIS